MASDVQSLPASAAAVAPDNAATAAGSNSNGAAGQSKKRKRNSERARVTRACDRCKKRKIKCNGTQPCEFCIRAKSNCTFDAAYARGRAPIIPSAADVHFGSNGGGPSASVEDVSSLSAFQYADAPQNGDDEAQSAAPGAGIQNRMSTSYTTRSTSVYAGASSQSSPEPPGTDLQGHYIGPASGISFLLRVQKRLHQAISVSSASTIFTFGDAPLNNPEFDPSFCMMLPRDDAQRLVDRYFDFAMPTYRFLHRPTMQEWFTEFYDTLGVMHDAQSAPAKVALLFMVFAQARVYMPDNDRPGPSDLSTRYYLAAEHQLTKERGSIRLTSVQARLTQCYYLLTQSRINHCWSLFGTVSHLALAIGLNRNRRASPKSGLSMVESECRRRTFWCAYTLDAYLSVSLGRPRSFHDDDIDADLPSCVDDEDLSTDGISPSTLNRGTSTMLAPLAHIKLARIISKIVRDLYSIKPISSSRREVLTERIARDLSDWRVELSKFLDANQYSTSIFVPIFQRQRNVLNLTYWHAIILTHRPFMLSTFARLTRQGASGGSEGPQTEESVRQCLTAAMSTVKTIDDITQTRQMFRAFWITAYFAFTANIVLYIYVIQRSPNPPETYSNYYIAATRCQSHISAIAAKGSLSERYCLVLEELRVEALRQVRRLHPSVASLGEMDDRPQLMGGAEGLQGMPMPVDESPATCTSYGDVLGENAIDFNGMPSSAFGDTSGWGQFASMVSSGMGNFDLFLNEEGFNI